MNAPGRPPPPTESRPSDHQRKIILSAAVGFLLLSALVVILLPLRLPLPVRLAVAGTDLIAAAIIALLIRQKYGSR